MLNELQEYKEYTDHNTSPELMPRRLHKQNIKSSRKGEISGISRPMLIIARKYLFDNSVSVLEKRIKLAKDALMSWLGYSNNEASLASWLKNYCRSLYPGFEESIDAKSTLFSRGIFPKMIFTDNDFNAIRYDHILAEALREGKLKQQYLICDMDPIVLMTSDIKKRSKTNSIENLRRSDFDTLLKLTAYYLLQRNNSDQKYAFANMIDVCNWIGRNAQNSRSGCFSRYYYKGEESLVEYRELATNRRKIALSDEWICHFRIIDENELDQYKGYFFMSDGGYSKSLLDGLGKTY